MPDTDKEMEAIRYLIHDRLNRGPEAAAVTSSASDTHLDEDAIGAFVESRLKADESSAIISHLVACGSCRDATARLIRLESLSIAGDEVTTSAETPNRLRQFLADLAAQVVPSSGEDAVFAYQNPDDDPKSDDNTKPGQKDSSTESTK